MTNNLIINLHGFNSAPGGKAEFLREHFGDSVVAPQLPIETKDALSITHAVIDRHQGANIHIVGTSLGGFYALYVSLSRKESNIFYHLINTPLTPHLDLAQYEGQTLTNFKTGEPSFVSLSFIRSLEAMSSEIRGVMDKIAPEKYPFISSGQNCA
ncbi:MAG: hypothetical protein LBR10_11780 [Prevotellaceae bacterium]|jgi:predicted esterase YcpF (UPF0227 family)|nr:hypothetical protein [Prevotellaceae bacterium]